MSENQNSPRIGSAIPVTDGNRFLGDVVEAICSVWLAVDPAGNVIGRHTDQRAALQQILSRRRHGEGA